MGVATENEPEFGRGDLFPDHVQEVVTDDPLRRGKVANAHPHDPALGFAKLVALPLLDILLHWDVFGLPVVRHHFLVKLPGPGILQREKVEKVAGLSSDYTFPGVDGLPARWIEVSVGMFWLHCIHGFDG